MMETTSKAETRKAASSRERKDSQNESEEELQPPSPIHIASEAALASEFEFPDALELRRIESDTQNRLKAILEVAGVTGLSKIDARTFQDPEILRKLTNSVSTALDEAATALTRMKSEKQTYEAFLRGANQAPSPAPLISSLPQSQQQYPQTHGVSSSHVTSAAPTTTKMSGSVNLGGRQHQGAEGGGHYHGRPQQQPQHQQISSQFHQSQDHGQLAGLTQPTDSMQTVQRLLTQGHAIQEATEDGESLLSLACSAGYYELAEVLLRMRASVEDRGVKGSDSTPLMEAASGGYADIVKLLIDHGANVNAKSSVGNTALTYACCGGYEDVVKILLDAGADVEHQNENGHTPLMEAASCGHVGVAKLLLQYGANINTHSNEFKESALTLACYKGHLEMVKFLLSAGADQEHKTDEMHTALMEASMDGHVDVARLLLDHGAQVNMPVDSFESPLTLAACGGHYELAALLISRGADLEEVNDEGYTPLMEAAREGHEDVVMLLVEHGANVNAQTEETQETALTLACCGGFMEVAQYLIEHGANIELGASTPLMEASQEGHVAIVKFLIERGANIHAETSTGDTALTYACANGHTIIADILLQCGAELGHESEGGRTPLMKAARAGHLQTVQFLVAKGANVNRRTAANDHTVLSLASAGGHISVVQYLLMKGAEPSYMLRDGSTMLIEASRGGHTNVANLLLRQSRGARAAAAAAARDQQRPSSHNQHTEAKRTSSLNRKNSSLSQQQQQQVVGPSTDQQRLQQQAVQKEHHLHHHHHHHHQCGVHHENGTSQQQQQESSSSATSRRSEVEEEGGGEKERGSMKPSFDGNEALKMSQQESSSWSGGGGVKHAVVAGGGTSLAKTQDLEARRQAIRELLNTRRPSNEITQQEAHNSSEGIPSSTATSTTTTTATGKQVSNSTTSNVVPSSSSVPPNPPVNLLGSIVPTHYATNSSTAIVNMQKSSSSQPQSSSTGVSQSGTNEGAQKRDEHVTTDDIITSYAMQRSVLEAQQKGVTLPNRVSMNECASTPPSSALSTPMTESSVMESAQSMFSSGNFSTLPVPLSSSAISQGDYHVPQFHASSSSSTQETTSNPLNQPSSLPNATNGIPSSSSSSVDSMSLSNMDLSRLIPHLEALAGSLQNPSLFESQYLASLTAQSQLFPSLASTSNCQTLPNSLDVSQHPPPNSHTTTTTGGDNKQPNVPPIPLGGIDPIGALAKFTSADIAKLLPNMVAMESQNAAITPSEVPPNHPIYASDLDVIAQLSQKMQAGVSMQESASGGGRGYSDDGQQQAGGTEVDLRTRSLPASFLLDNNFPLDIPPPNDLIPEHLIPAGYEGSLPDNDSYHPSSYEGDDDDDDDDEEEDEDEEEEEELDEEESDSSYLSPDMSTMLPGSFEPAIDIDQQTESNHDTALTLAAAGGHDELVELLIAHGANIEHKDKKGCTPLILAASAGHAVTVAILLDHNADIEAQSDRTKDTALSLACSGGRQEVVQLLLEKGANYEHRNVSDYTPLSLAASGGYVNIIKLLLRAGADINSRTGSKLGISPLMLAAMNGHTSTVKLLLDMGSDINAQIETNRNTALTLACFQGRHEVVNLLVERQANVEHRAKTGLTPLMEAASGGYHEVGKVLISKGADVNAAPVPSSRDSALTIAADKGHYKFVELILRYGAHVDVKNKKGNSPLWLASNGGHLDVVRLLVEQGAEVDSQDNRKVSCLMATFRKGHFKVVKYLVEHVSQFPSDAELTRYINTLSDKELLKKCQRCMEVIIDAKERQAAEANKNATILLQEIDLEKKHEEDRKAAAARKRAKKKRQKEKKQALKAQKEGSNGAAAGDTPPEGEPGDGLDDGMEDLPEDDTVEVPEPPEPIKVPDQETRKRKDSGGVRKRDSLKKSETNKSRCETAVESRQEEENQSPNHRIPSVSNEVPPPRRNVERKEQSRSVKSRAKSTSQAHPSTPKTANQLSNPISATSRVSPIRTSVNEVVTTPTNSPRKGRKEEGWKEVGRRTKKVTIPSSAFNSVVGKNNCNLTAIKQATCTHIEVDKHAKQSPHRTLTIRGSTDAIKQAHQCITSLVRDPNQDLTHLLSKIIGTPSSSTHSTTVPPSSVSAPNKRHVTASHDPTPSLATLDSFDEPSAAPPAKGSTTIAHASVTVSTISGTAHDAKLSHRKIATSAGNHHTSSSQAANASGGSGSGRPTTHATVQPTQASSSQGTTNTTTSRSGGRKTTLSSTSGGSGASSAADSLKITQQHHHQHHHHAPVSSIDHKHTHAPSVATHASRAVASSVASSGGSVNTKTGGSSGNTSGAIRRLFTSTTASQDQPHATVPLSLVPTMSQSSQPLKPPSTTVVSSANMGLRPAPVPITSTRVQPPGGGGNTVSGSGGISSHSARPSGDKSSQPVSVASRAHDGGNNTIGGRSGMRAQSGTVVGGDSGNHKAAGAVHPMVKGVQGAGAGGSHSLSMTYSSVINSASTVESAASNAQQLGHHHHHHPRLADVIEQPLQQIMKTPTIFQEPATQLAKPKKKSTYSDAVGKKPGSASGGANSSVSGGVGVVGNSGSGSDGSVKVGVGGGIQPVVVPAPQAKLNLAPGSRLSGDKTSQISGEKRTRSTPWSEMAIGDKSFEAEEEQDVRPSLTSGLGPIGPPSKISKQSQPTSNIPIPGSTNRQGVPPPTSAVATGNRSYSPASGPGGSLSKTSPTSGSGFNTSPHRNELSPAAKSPLLGTAPPGLLPPPEKGAYNTAFRPIQQYHSGEFSPSDSSNATSPSNTFPTVTPTPLRNSRPPLLATPPGFPYIQQGMRQSPVPSPEKLSPNKSPPNSTAKGFNPNAPSFVPMALQQRPTNNPPTGSILGAPPKFPGFGPPPAAGGTSILGNAPHLGTSMYSGNNQPRMMSQQSMFPNQPPPPPPPPQPGPPQQSQGNQSSILGHPPTAPLNPHMFTGGGGGGGGGGNAPPPPPPPGGPQAFQTLQNRAPPVQPGVPGMYGHQLDASQPPPPPGAPMPPPATSLIQPPPIHPPPPFGMNIPPSFPGQQAPPTQSVNGQPGVSFVGQQNPNLGSSLKEAFPSNIESSIISGKPQVPDGSDINPASIVAPQQTLLLSTGASMVQPYEATQLHHVGGGGGGGGVPGSGTAHTSPSSTDNLYNITLGQLGPIDTPPPELGVDGQNMVFTTSSTGYIVMSPGVFTTAEAMYTTTIDPASQATARPSSRGDGDSLLQLPIGTERAQKSASLPSVSFPVLTPGITLSSVWSYSGNPLTQSEDSDWSSSVPPESLSWPSSMKMSVSSVQESSVIVTPQDSLNSVLEKVGLTEYQKLFQENEVDLEALLLMSDNDFSEIGLPAGPRYKLRSLISQNPKPTNLSGMNSTDSSEQSTNPNPDESPASRPASSLKEASQ